jgi:hypothetical protein
MLVNVDEPRRGTVDARAIAIVFVGTEVLYEVGVQTGVSKPDLGHVTIVAVTDIDVDNPLLRAHLVDDLLEPGVGINTFCKCLQICHGNIKSLWKDFVRNNHPLSLHESLTEVYRCVPFVAVLKQMIVLLLNCNIRCAGVRYSG